MEIISTVDDTVTLTATRKELTRLSMLLDFIVDNLGGMDRATISLPEDDIMPAVLEWLKLLEGRTAENA